jgi:hypothetical protein
LAASDSNRRAIAEFPDCCASSLKGVPFSSERLAEGGKSLEKTRGTFDIVTADGEGEVAEFNAE